MSNLSRLNAFPPVQDMSPSSRRPRLAVRLLPLLLSLLAAVPGFAAPPSWAPATRAGGTVTALALAPSAPEILYAGTKAAGVFRSQDGGKTWESRAAALAPADLAIWSLVVDPRDADTVFAVPFPDLPGTHALVRSRDGGMTWDALGGPNDLKLGYVIQVAVDGAGPGTLFAASDKGLYRSQDLGDTWQLLAFGGKFVNSVAADPRRPGVVFAATLGNDPPPDQVWRSLDSGRTWQATPFSGYSPSGLTVDPTRAGTVYVLADLLYKSTDDGASWVALFNPGPAVFALSPWGVLYASWG